MIFFTADVKLDDGTNLDVIPGGRRFSPNLQFDLPGLQNERFGLATVMPVSRIRSGMEGRVKIEMIGVEQFRELANLLAPGVRFTLSQGPIAIGSGVIRSVEDATIDAD